MAHHTRLAPALRTRTARPTRMGSPHPTRDREPGKVRDMITAAQAARELPTPVTGVTTPPGYNGHSKKPQLRAHKVTTVTTSYARPPTRPHARTRSQRSPRNFFRFVTVVTLRAQVNRVLKGPVFSSLSGSPLLL